MEQKSMTALVSAFSRAYHCENNKIKVFNDTVAKLLLTQQEYQQISSSMAQGIQFFNPGFVSSNEEALRWIVDNQLSPSPLGRSAFAEQLLEKAAKSGVSQYLIFAAGYDSFAYRQPSWADQLQIFELDHPVMSADKQERIKIFNTSSENLSFIPVDLTNTGIEEALLSYPKYYQSKTSFCSLLGISYYLTKDAFIRLIQTISRIVTCGSTIVFDYPDQDTYTDKAGQRSKKQTMLAGNAGEAMLAGYSYSEIETLLCEAGFQISIHLKPQEITEKYFAEYNRANPKHKITAFDNVNYCMAIKH